MSPVFYYRLHRKHEMWGAAEGPIRWGGRDGGPGVGHSSRGPKAVLGEGVVCSIACLSGPKSVEARASEPQWLRRLWCGLLLPLFAVSVSQSVRPAAHLCAVHSCSLCQITLASCYYLAKVYFVCVFCRSLCCILRLFYTTVSWRNKV